MWFKIENGCLEVNLEKINLENATQNRLAPVMCGSGQNLIFLACIKIFNWSLIKELNFKVEFNWVVV